jgi:hypothetical protein
MKLKYFSFLPLVLATAMSSCVKDELYNGPASISTVTAVPAAPQSDEVVTISAKITDLRGINTAKVFYRTSTTGAFVSVDMTTPAKFSYTGTIPALAMGTKVDYYIEVINSTGFTSTYPAAAPEQLATYTVGASNVIKLYVNEVFADGTKDPTDPDWVELYNGSDIPVNISGYAFYDEGIRASAGTKAKRILNAGTIIPSKGFIVIKTEYTAGEYSVEFGLSTTGDAIFLENTSGVMVASLDFLTINLTGKKSYGRQPDGSSNLVTFASPTRGTSNN